MRSATRYRHALLGAVGLLATVALFACPSSQQPLDHSGPVAGWPEYAGAPGGGKFSEATQITPKNVHHLEVAWTHHSGDVRLPSKDGLPQSSFQTTPILVDDTLIFCSAFNRIIALDAETGRERWSFDPEIEVDGLFHLACRGASHWRDETRAEDEACRDRILMGTLDSRLLALDVRDGQPCRDFGDAGEVDLTLGIGDLTPTLYGVTSPPAIIANNAIVGSYVVDNYSTDVPGGVVRAFDVRTGALNWAWDPVPPDAIALPDGTYRRTTANAWSVFSVDRDRNLVFVPTGNAGPDIYGGDRQGADHYSSSVIALDASSGELVWQFQTVHHDLWDYDVPAQPTLFDFTADGKTIPALVQSTKMGHLFFLNRETGEPIFPVEERPVPQGAVTGETLSPTQPFPTKPAPLHPHEFGPDDAWGPTPWGRAKCREMIAGMRHEGIFTPPSLEGTVLQPGALGGGNWGGVTIDPDRNILVVNNMRVPMGARLVPREDYDARPDDHQKFTPMLGTPYGLDFFPLFSPIGVPCNAPPWGVLQAVSTTTGDLLWEVPLGTTRDLAPWPFWYFKGVPNLGGPVSTASGLTFIAATTDDFLRAFDTRSGRELWKGRLPAGGQATPMTYRLKNNGRQFVVIAAGGHSILQTTPGDALVAFALPDDTRD
jgi:quinoprotein glucose dehydrogenase